jgi:outer membrane protein assembly factor BamB
LIFLKASHRPRLETREKNMKTFLIPAMLLLTLSLAAENTPRVEWAYETTGKIYASPVIVDLEDDGAIEVIVAASRARELCCFDGQGNLRWVFRMADASTDGFQANPSVADYDGDGRKEIFWLTRGGTAGCIDADGRLIWRVFTGDSMDYTGPVAADVNGDGRIELVFGSESGTLYCLDDAGQTLWRHQGRGAVRGIPGVLPRPGAASMLIYAAFGGGEEICFDHDGNVIWKHNEPLPRAERRSAVALGDIDGDGDAECISATEDFRVIVRDAVSGREEWRWKGKGNTDQTCSFALADFDGSGGLDIVTGDYSGHVYRLRGGEAVWETQVAEGRGGIVQGPSIGDVDGDGELEILVCARSKRLVCLDADGKEEWDFEVAAQPLTTPALGDIDSDGEVEIVFTGKDGFVRSLGLGGAYDPEKLPWPMLARDPQLSNNYNGATFTPEPAEMRMIENDALIPAVKGVFRMGANAVPFTFSNQSHRPRRLEVTAELTRPGGSVISQVISDVLAPWESRQEAFTADINTSGIHTIEMRMADTGTGNILAEWREQWVQTAFKAEREQAAAIKARAEKMLEETGSPDLRERARNALDAADKTFFQALAAASEPAGRNQISQAHKALEALRRIVARLDAAAATPGDADRFAAVMRGSMEKIFRDEVLPRAAQQHPDTVRLAKNEYESAQLIVVPLWEPLKNVRVTVKSIRAENGAELPVETHSAVYPAGYVEIGPPEYNWHVEKAGYYPDILLENQPMDIPADQDTQPFFITFHTTPDTPAGLYTAAIEIAAENATPVTAALEIEVWDFTLPDETALKTSFWMNERFIRAFYGYEDVTPEEVRRRYYDLHLDHRVSPIKDFPLETGWRRDDFDYLMANGQNCFFIPIPERFDNPEGRAAWKEKVDATAAYLKEKGWEKDALYYARDEVAVMARHLIPEVAEMNRWVMENLPDYPVLETSAPEQALTGAVDVWCPTIDHFEPAMLENRMDAGDRLWFYTVWGRPGIMIEFPNTDYRVMFWQCRHYGAEGFLYWGTTHWAYNTDGEARWPERPWMPWNSQPGHHGCGYLIYPGTDGQPLASIRLSLVRDGIEDYEYFHLLENLYEKKKSDLNETMRTRIETALAVDKTVVIDNETYTESPAAILDARAELADLILHLRD